jgi:hypothetical protein
MPLSVIFRICQIAIALYIIVSVIVIKKGYQITGAVSGTTLVKTKGSAYNSGGLPWYNQAPIPDDYTQIYDSTDLVFPPMERDATFITTNLYFTPNQTRSACYPGSDDWYNGVFPTAAADASCQKLCVRGTAVNEASTRTGGVWTGMYTLKPNTTDPTQQNCYCQLQTWCPDENILPFKQQQHPFSLQNVDTWTVSFRQNVEFQAFGVVTTNLSPKDNPTPPIYSIAEMLDSAGLAYTDVQQSGAVIVLSSKWKCNLDYSTDQCNPDVSFVNLGQSFNFRRAEYGAEGVPASGAPGTRQLIKHYGIRILIILSGTGGRWDPAAFFTNIGSGIGLLAVATLVADFVACNILGQKELYEKAKFRPVEINEDGTTRGLSFSHPHRHAGPDGAASAGGAGGHGTGTPVYGSTNDIDLDGGRQLAIETRGGSQANIIPANTPKSDRHDEQEEPWGKAKI